MLKTHKIAHYLKLSAIILFIGIIVIIALWAAVSMANKNSGDMPSTEEISFSPTSTQNEDFAPPQPDVKDDEPEVTISVLQSAGIKNPTLSLFSNNSFGMERDGISASNFVWFKRASGTTTEEDAKKFLKDSKRENLSDAAIIDFDPRESIGNALSEKGFTGDSRFSGDGGPNFSEGFRKESVICVLGGTHSTLALGDEIDYLPKNENYSIDDEFGEYHFSCFSSNNL